ncbi:MAG TPA: response regulator, partial [Blastocatellia bacterium]|nr:response regulator [Blastocatellia bacterium]
MQNGDKVGVVVDDMFFAAKIRGAIESAGRVIERVKSREQLEQLAADAPALMIVDLNSDRLNPLDVIEFCKAQPALRDVPIIGFLSHVQVDLKRQAEMAGCDYVIPRSLFS